VVKLGIVLILFSVAFLVVCLFSPDIIAPLAPLYCPAGQTLSSKTYTYSRPGETSSTNVYHCVNADHVEQADVSGPIMITVMGGFFILMFGGVILTSIGGNRVTRARKATNNYVLSTANFGGSSSGTPSGSAGWNASANAANQETLDNLMNGLQQGVIRFGGQEIHVDDLRSGNYQMVAGQSSKHTLADTLRQLQEARDQGLIDSDEYGRLRQEALDKRV